MYLCTVRDQIYVQSALNQVCIPLLTQHTHCMESVNPCIHRHYSEQICFVFFKKNKTTTIVYLRIFLISHQICLSGFVKSDLLTVSILGISVPKKQS